MSTRLLRPCKKSPLDDTFFFFLNPSFFFGPFFTDSRALGYEETVIITLATVSVLAVLAVAAFFGYRMMHGEFNAAARRRFFFVPFKKKKKWTYSFIFSLFLLVNTPACFFALILSPVLLPPVPPLCVCVRQETGSKAFTT